MNKQNIRVTLLRKGNESLLLFGSFNHQTVIQISQNFNFNIVLTNL